MFTQVDCQHDNIQNKRGAPRHYRLSLFEDFNYLLISVDLKNSSNGNEQTYFWPEWSSSV